ncbi:MAG: hypothetical protein ACOCRK_10675 [bacterium]
MIVVRFRDSKDDELKEWYENLPEGERSRIVRNILKENAKIIEPKYSRRIINSQTKENNIDQKINDIIKNF